jgi:hypothetical protein
VGVPPVLAALVLGGFTAGSAVLAWLLSRWRPMHAVSG